MRAKQDFAALQSIGKRDEQQDRVWIEAIRNNEGVRAIISDGMGGHNGGAVAASLVVQAFSDSQEIQSSPWSFRDNLERADAAIASHVGRNPEMKGMGATIVALEFLDNRLRWISVGDSMLLLWRNGELSRLNADHSMAPILDAQVKNGELTHEEARNSSSRHLLRSAITGDKIDLIDEAEIVIPPGDEARVVVASDGLDVLSFGKIGDLLTRHSEASAYALCEHLLDAVDDCAAPYQDNTTVAVLCLG